MVLATNDADPKQDMLEEFGHFNPIIHELIQ